MTDKFTQKIQEEAKAILNNLNYTITEQEYNEREERIAEAMKELDKEAEWAERVLGNRG